MTMLPSQNGKQQNNNNRSSGDYVFYSNTTTTTTRTTTSAMNQVEVEGGYNCLLGSEFVVRRSHMATEAEEESSSRLNNTTNNNEAEAEPGGSTSKEEEEEGPNNNNNNTIITTTTNNNNNNWLQLSIGFHQSSTIKRDLTIDRTGSGLVELDLLPSQPATNFPAVASGRGCEGSGSLGGCLVLEQTTSSSMSMAMGSGGPISSTNISSSTFGHQEMMNMNWAFGPLLPHPMPIMPSSNSSFITTPLIPNSSSSNSSSSHSSLRPPLLAPYNFPTPFHHFPSSSSTSAFDQYYDVAGAGPSSDVTVRVVDPPRRPHSGIWFMLQASQNQAKEPFLPQIPKNYLRIKDGRMTVRLLLKYLVSKLRLESESEIEITCRGQQLLPFLTLQHVRDNIWSPRDTTRALLSDSSTTDHVMVLHYGRSTT
ncbi:hypothetical protein VNO77_21516 [Canavalia gladiata]|uniref:Uncharacterized protein n=1 Tax=Canavalia gladiata TaxID=3824 RepID=A0AAN9QRM5_CANGL